jgi:multiple sugar transport system permease protein
VADQNPFAARWRRGWITSIGTVVLCAVVLFPFYWMVVTALREDATAFAYPPQIAPTGISWHLLVELFTKTEVSRWLRTSLLVALSTSIAAVTVGTFGGYALSRFHARGLSLAGYLILTTQMIPPLLLLVPMFILFREVGLLDTVLGLIVINFATSLPVSVWLLKTAFDAVPPEVEEAAIVDGCSRLGVLLRIVVPLSTPGIAAAGAFAFIEAWNEFVFARTFISNPANLVAPVGLSSLLNENAIAWQQVMATATVITLPPVALFLLTQRFFVQGLSAGAVKG